MWEDLNIHENGSDDKVLVTVMRAGNNKLMLHYRNSKAQANQVFIELFSLKNLLTTKKQGDRLLHREFFKMCIIFETSS